MDAAKTKSQRVIISVAGKDRTGIIGAISTALSEHAVNIEDISQTILQGNFVMIMIADMSNSSATILSLGEALGRVGQRLGVDVRVQHEDIFNTMHRL